MRTVLHIITGLNDGGAEAVLTRLCLNDKSRKHLVVSMMGEGKYGPFLRKEGVPVVCLDMRQGKIAFGGILKLWRLLRISRPDVVQTWMYHADLVGGILAKAAGVNRVFWGIRHSTLDPHQSKRSTIWVARACAALSHWIPRRIICCADSAKIVHAALGYSSRKFVVIPNGYDLTRFSPSSEKRDEKKVGVNGGKVFSLGMVGRFDPQKDHRNLLNAVRSLKDEGFQFSLTLVGRGLDETNVQLSSWLDDLRLKSCVRLLGPQNDIPGIMRNLDIHVLSSAYGEAFPNVLAEAMACGTPCVATDVGDASLIVGSTGWIVPPSDSDALAGGIRSAIREMASADGWGARCIDARDRVKSYFGLDRMIEAYHSAWDEGER